MRASLEDRLLSHFEIDLTTGCWNWSASKRYNGYGQITSAKKNLYPHRVSFEVHIGKIPLGLHVCHSCDNRACINPDHLFLGTPADNNADRNAKGRQAKGKDISKNRRSMAAEGNGRAKLTESDVLAIRAQSIGCTTLARKYGISQSQILRIRKGDSWQSVIHRVPASPTE